MHMKHAITVTTRMTLPIFRLGNFLQKTLQISCHDCILNPGCFGGGVDPSLLCLSTNPTNPPGSFFRPSFFPSVFWTTITFVTENSSGVWNLVIPSPFRRIFDFFFGVRAGSRKLTVCVTNVYHLGTPGHHLHNFPLHLTGRGKCLPNVPLKKNQSTTQGGRQW